MIYTPDNPWRDEEAEAGIRFMQAKVEIYQCVLELCADVRSLLERLGKDDVPTSRAFAARVKIVVLGTHENLCETLGIDMHIQDTKNTFLLPSGRLRQYVQEWLSLEPTVVCDVFQRVPSPHRQAVADFILPRVKEEGMQRLNDEGRYDEMGALEESLERFREQLIAGNLPSPEAVCSPEQTPLL